ncbi:MAG: PAS domain S-box protein [Chlorobiaceae bacterium]|nr:PAS domain S-box protein [Chlorobiaceae bacterium]
MKKKSHSNNPENSKELRTLAESRLKLGKEDITDLLSSPDEVLRMIHELNVHKIELEIQQEELIQSRNELEKSLNRYTDLYDFAPLGYMTIARDSKLLELNLTISTMLGVERSRLYGRPFKMFVHSEDHKAFDTLLEQVFNERVPGYVEVEFSAGAAGPSKKAHPLAGHVFRIDASISDKADACLIILSDITQRKHEERIRQQYEEKIFENEQFFKSIYDEVSHSIFVVEVSADGSYRYKGHNAINEKLIGISNEELKGKTPEQVFDPQIATSITRNYDSCIREGKTIQFLESLPFLGREMWWETTLSPVRDERGHIYRIIGTTTNITERKLAENQLQKQSRTLMVLNDCNFELLHANNEEELLDGICRAIFADGSYRMVWVGYAEYDQAKSIRPVAHAGFEDGYLDTVRLSWEDIEQGADPAGRAIHSGKPETTRNKLSDPNFKPWREEAVKRGYVSSLSLPLKDGEQVFGALTIYTTTPDTFDTEEIKLLSSLAENLAYGITMLRIRKARESAEKELRQSEERYRTLFQNKYTVMMIFDPLDGQIIDANPAAENFYGWSRNELLKMNVTQINTLSEQDVKSEMQKARSMERNYFNFRHRRADGSFRDVEVVSGPITLMGKSLLYSIVHDVTERKKFQEAFLESNKRMNVIMNSTNAGIWEVDFASNDVYWSDEIWRLYGIDENGCTPSLENWLNTIIQEDRPTIEKTVADAIKNAAEYNSSWRVRDPDGSMRWLMAKGTPFTDAGGKVLKYVGIVLDITERKREEDEKKKLESRILKSERLETIGTLAGGIAHDFNNILTPIMGYAELGMIKLPDEDPLRQYFKEIMMASERAQNLVSQILTFSRAQESEPSNVSVQSIIDEALMLMRSTIPSTIMIEKHLDPACRNILADPSKIHQVIVNLCTNAYQAMENSGGTLTIELEEVTPDKNLLNMLPELYEQPYAKLTISDTGYGIDRMTMDHIFEPFFTTKPVNKGTGLGLSVVHGIITGYKGVINVESQPGKGCSFQIFLPIVDHTVTGKEHKQVFSCGNASILFIDDEEPTCKMMTMMLTELGHKALSFISPREALELFRQSPDEFNLVITDLTMPEMTGIKLASEIHAYKPEIPIILMTGFGKDIDSVKELEIYGIHQLIKKPIKIENIVSAINKICTPVTTAT